jgi:hypothetical protein
VRFPFRQLPAAGGGQLTSRPTVDVWLEGIDAVPLASLVDTGALRTRFSRDLATAAGIQPDDDLAERFAIGGAIVTGAPARVLMRVGSGDDVHAWMAPVWFCDPWPFGFQLLGLEGFLQHFRVTLSAYHEWIDCQPEN